MSTAGFQKHLTSESTWTFRALEKILEDVEVLLDGGWGGLRKLRVQSYLYKKIFNIIRGYVYIIMLLDI